MGRWLGVEDLGAFNKSLLAKQGWRMLGKFQMPESILGGV